MPSRALKVDNGLEHLIIYESELQFIVIYCVTYAFLKHDKVSG